MTDSMFTPFLDRDLICGSSPTSSTFSGLPIGFGSGYNPYMNTNLLGGVTMASPLASDVYGGVRNARFRNWQSMKTICTGIFAAGATLFVGSKFGKLFRAIGSKFRK